MKFNLRTIFSLLILISFAFLHSKETVRVGAYENSPKIFTDEQGKVSGFWADITNYIAEKEDWEIVWVHGTWDECLERLEKIEIDLMVDTGWNEERSQKFIFTKETVLLSWSALYVQNGFVFQSINDLKGRKIGVMKNSINYSGPDGIKNLLEKFEIGCEFVEFESYEDVFKAIENKKVDAGVTNKQFGEMHENEFIMKTSMEFLPSKLLFSLPANSVRSDLLIGKIDARIRELKSDEESVYYKSMNKWYGKIVAKSYIPLWVYWGIAVLISGIVALYILNILLSRIIRKKTEELKLANAEMEKKVIERTSELSEANNKLKELDHLKSMFIASMSHELRTPLNSIIGFTGLILQGISGKIDDQAKEDLEIVYNSSKHLLNLINDVIDISKIEADKFEVYFQEIRLDDLLAEAVANVTRAAQTKGIKINAELPDGTMIRTDRKRLFQCVLNLLSNAIKYTEKGYISIRTERSDSMLSVIVKDSGIGIKSEDISKLFHSFIRLESPIKENTLGTGLGLYLTKKIMTSVFHGNIKVESKVGEGSTFTLEIPLNTEV
ncbi:TPA: hypothetical protein DCR49_10400 [Candidatus Delongbacteria bacterium]|nr:hypothetical protein [Candidatus Delongbacteria bacterium]